MAIIRRGEELTWVSGESECYVYLGVEGEIHIGDKNSEDETEIVELSPEDTIEIICHLLDRTDFDDVEGVRDALVDLWDRFEDAREAVEEDVKWGPNHDDSGFVTPEMDDYLRENQDADEL